MHYYENIETEDAFKRMFLPHQYLAGLKVKKKDLMAMKPKLPKVGISKIIVKRWSSMMKGTPKEDHLLLASMLEGQKVFNECMEERPGMHAFKRLSIALVRRLFDRIDRKKVSLTAEVTGKFGDYTIIDSNLEFDLFEEDNRSAWEAYQHRLDYDRDWVDTFSQKIADRINEEYESFLFRAFNYLNYTNVFVIYGNLKKREI